MLAALSSPCDLAPCCPHIAVLLKHCPEFRSLTVFFNGGAPRPRLGRAVTASPLPLPLPTLCAPSSQMFLLHHRCARCRCRPSSPALPLTAFLATLPRRRSPRQRHSSRRHSSPLPFLVATVSRRRPLPRGRASFQSPSTASLPPPLPSRSRCLLVAACLSLAPNPDPSDPLYPPAASIGGSLCCSRSG